VHRLAGNLFDSQELESVIGLLLHDEHGGLRILHSGLGGENLLGHRKARFG